MNENWYIFDHYKVENESFIKMDSPYGDLLPHADSDKEVDTYA
ncbi:hypothetical protein [Salsuginibacillus kocurii]|nr:hypothetical protein [Salsuginibacillus kocurii]